MQPQTLDARVERLEPRVTILERLPARVDALVSQISQLREEIRVEFSTVRGEIQAADEETRRTLRDETRAGDEETRRVLVDEIRVSGQRIMDHARVLYEDMKATVALLREGQASS